MSVNIKIDESVKCNSNWSLFVSFEYNSTVVDIIRGFPTRYWNANNKSWELPFKVLDELVEALKDFEIDIEANSVEMFNIPKKAELATPFEFKTTPFNHQIEGFNYGLEHNAWLLGDEQGLGKTKQVIDIACAKKLMYGYKHCLIICGVNGLKWNWKNEVSTHSNERGYILGERKRKNGKIIIGTVGERLEDLNNLDNIDAYFLITNVETLRNEDIARKINELCKANVIGIVAVDEIHKCLDYNTWVETDKGEYRIGDIVTNRLDVMVKSYNEATNEVEYKRILNYFENAIADPMMELDIEFENGETSTIRCTSSHKFLTRNRGWVMATDLNEFDDIIDNL